MHPRDKKVLTEVKSNKSTKYQTTDTSFGTPQHIQPMNLKQCSGNSKMNEIRKQEWQSGTIKVKDKDR